MKYLGAIDQGTSSTRFILFDSKGQALPISPTDQTEFTQIRPHSGWLEHDPIEILNTVRKCVDSVMNGKSVSAEEIAAVGITNQRETCVLWDKFTGKPLHNAIVWSDTRTTHLVDKLKLEFLDENVFKKSCGLPLANYFSAVKILWMMINCKDVADAIRENKCLFGTVDTWIIWNLTGGVNGGKHVTDVSNASRTMLMNLATLDWDPDTCKKLGIPMNILPKIQASSSDFGIIADGPLKGVQISGCIGDQQAATLGQLCLEPGSSKGTYGTGCFMLLNTGKEIKLSNNGLLTTALFKLGENEPAYYALEGSVAACGSMIRWLRDNLEFIKESSEINKLAKSVPDTGGVYFVNAFSGLFAPRWRADARGTIVGITDATTKAHIARAVVESVAFSSKELIDAMENDSKQKLHLYKIDGGMSRSDLLSQYLADFLRVEVARPAMLETTALGAAIAAGLFVGIWKNPKEMASEIGGSREYGTKFHPMMNESLVTEKLRHWNRAVDRSLGWIESEERIKQAESSIAKKLPSFLYGMAIGSILMFSFAKLLKK